MVIENLCFAMGICFVGLYAASIGTTFWFLTTARRKESMALHRIRCPNRDRQSLRAERYE